MRILYVAKHNSGDNDDEGAVYWSLEQLGHDVVRINERYAGKALRAGRMDPGTYDFLLMHKWEDLQTIRWLAEDVKLPVVFWYFDLVESDDWHLQQRGQARRQWMEAVTPLVTVGFCTDGDWARIHGHVPLAEQPMTYPGEVVLSGPPPRLVHLMQGADERFAGAGTPRPEYACDLIFTGSTIHGGKRISHVDELRARYGERFVVFGETPKLRKHGRELADVLASAKIVIAPDGPVTDSYWSNRIYLTLGFGAFLLHPYCGELAFQYAPNHDLIYYRSRAELHDLIAYYLVRPEERAKLAAAGYARTMAEHTYRRRCETLVRTAQERLK